MSRLRDTLARFSTDSTASFDVNTRRGFCTEGVIFKCTCGIKRHFHPQPVCATVPNRLPQGGLIFFDNRLLSTWSSFFPKSSLLDNDFVLLDVERKGAIDFRSLILACRLSTKNKFTPIFVQTCNPFQLYMKNNISWSPQTIKKLMSIRLVFAKNREERMRWAFKV